MFLENIPDSHVRLFRREILDLMTHDDYCHLIKFVTSIQCEKLESVSWDLGKEVLFKCVAFSSVEGAIDALKSILKKRKAPRQIRIQLGLEKLRTHKYYAKLLFNVENNDPYKMDRIAEVLEPEPIIEFLKQKNCREYDDLIERVCLYLDMKEVEDAACELLRGLPYCSDMVKSTRRDGDWYYDFLEACLSNGYTRMIPRYIDSEYDDELESFCAAREAENKKQVVFDADIVVTEATPTEPRPQSDYAQFRAISADIIYQAADYQLRPYQNELVTHAKRGRNTIICAPTGCGKTLVATDIIINHLRVARSEGKIARALMLVPTVPLVDQQTVEFVRFMAGEFWVDGFSGAESLSNRVENFLASDVCVVTPQVIINMLNSILKHEKLYFSDITLMIFDECHNCNEEHPYKILMDMLEKSDIPRKPQIVGLTASLGVGQTSWDIKACREHMLKMCSNLMVNSISTVRHQLDNLKSHVMPPVDVVQRARRPSDDEFNHLIKETMLKIEQKMKPTLEKVLEKQLIMIKKEDIIFPNHEQITRYQNVVGSLRKSVQRIVDPQLRLTLVRSIDHLSHYFHTIAISDLLPNRYAYMYLDAKMSLYSSTSNEDDINNFLLDCYGEIRKRLKQLTKKKNDEGKEILQKLYGILHNQYSEKPESRTLIFVATRACAQRLSEHLNEYLASCEDLRMFYKRQNNAGYMTSTNQSAGAGGQSSELQRVMREKFERGEVKILVVTSVADEGINIMECNLIIKYNTVGSERTLIQRRGRARAKDSKAILLALDGSVELQELENMKKETMMISCINDLQAHRDEMLQKMIADKTEQLRQIREQKELNLQEQYDRLSTRKYALKCRVCNNKICDSMDIRCVTNSLYVCCDPSVWHRSENKIIKRPTKDGLTTKCARWCCKNCQEEWGIVVKYSCVFLPMVSAKAFVLDRLDVSEEYRTTAMANIKTWAQIRREYFNVDPINSQNIKNMLYALASVSQQEHQSMEEQEQRANQFALEKRIDRQVKQKILLEE